MSGSLGGFGPSEIDFQARRQEDDRHDQAAVNILNHASAPARRSTVRPLLARPAAETDHPTKPQTSDMAGGYFIQVAGEERGPFTFAQLRGMWTSGRLTLSTLYRGPGAPAWEPLANLASDLEQVERPPKSRALYIVLGIFLGMLGVHNFYVGRYRRGFFQILLPLVGIIVALVSLPSLQKAQEDHFNAAVTAINEGRPYEKFTSAPSAPAMLALMGVASIAIMPFWVIGEIIFVSRDARGQKMI